MAINRLRAANLAAEKADDEKFALSDSVDARIPGLLDGRGEGLRALFGSLDQALWEDSGWEKVGMHGVHPNKLSQDASTEIKMNSPSVFATLNEAWDKLKIENRM